MGSRNENNRYEAKDQKPFSPPDSRFGFGRDRGLRNVSQDAKPKESRTQQQMMSMLNSLQQNFSSLLSVVNNRLSYDQTKEVAFDRLYKEMEEMKQDQELSQLRPLYIDLILLIDRMNTIYNDKLDSGEQNPELVSTLQTLSHEVLEILYRRGVDLIVATSNKFNPSIQQIVEVVPTNNPAEDNLVIHMVRHGFKYNDVVLRPEEVVVKKYQA
ncbi:nucleotide exchange factor GrpE [Hazenella sp. IB182357]|uniref:Nucleotide exchange factor GrpE n=1 Tax=Polycladospora coralii TaxID=2771432 RepID=A0A926RXE2_9BACL|nr:nucleotide exchange factor GrpE [Polycladospora coralii]MBD1372436.1 nucleotide exchange factor GrpE [Polycladospora coralii]MBS7531758.1 nucleotide exchange factor GrpE [Polycladospora coralii]